MPFHVPLPRRLKAQGWKVKIRERERLEPPHVTILCKTKEWRINLRNGSFLTPGGSWKDLDDELREIIAAHWHDLQNAWDKKYPTNPISSLADDDEDDDS